MTQQAHLYSTVTVIPGRLITILQDTSQVESDLWLAAHHLLSVLLTQEARLREPASSWGEQDGESADKYRVAERLDATTKTGIEKLFLTCTVFAKSDGLSGMDFDAFLLFVCDFSHQIARKLMCTIKCQKIIIKLMFFSRNSLAK